MKIASASGVLEMCPRAHCELATRSSVSRNKVKLPNWAGMRETPQCGWNSCRISRLRRLCEDTVGSHDLFYASSTCVAIRLRGRGLYVSMMGRGLGALKRLTTLIHGPHKPSRCTINLMFVSMPKRWFQSQPRNGAAHAVAKSSETRKLKGVMSPER